MSNILQKMILPVAALSLSLPFIANAHNVGENSLNNATFHLFLNLDHLLAVTALIILGKQLSKKTIEKKPVVLASIMITGGILAFAAPLLLIGICTFSSLLIFYRSRSWKTEK
ncbi:MAG: HupE/UreJ family protein [Patescibacteria group bacterium]